MISEYHRPDNLQDALALLARKSPQTHVLAGGLYINEILQGEFAVVDLQNLGLTTIKAQGNKIRYGAGVSLQSMLEEESTPPALKGAISHQETINRRHIASLGGTLAAASGRSAVAGVMLSLDAELELQAHGQEPIRMGLGDFLPLREELLPGKLISEITIPAGARSAYRYVARAPADLPILAAAVTRWPSGRTRVSLLGWGDQPHLVLDGPDAGGAEVAAEQACSEAGDQWASAEYRAANAAVLVRRCLADLE